MAAPLPECPRPVVCQEVVLHEVAFHQQVLEQLADKVHHMERMWGKSYLVSRDLYGPAPVHVRIDTKMPPIPDKVFTARTRVVGKKRFPLSSDMPSVPGPLPEGLRKGVYEAYYQSAYALFMRRTVALQEGTMSLEEVDADVFSILGFEGGKMDRDPGYQPFRDASTRSHRPDLYRMFVEWSSAQPLVVQKERKSDAFKFGVIALPTAAPMNFGGGVKTISVSDVSALDLLEKEKLGHDIKLLDDALAMCLNTIKHSCISETMKQALGREGGKPNFLLSLIALRNEWKKQLLKRVSTDTDMPNSE